MHRAHRRAGSFSYVNTQGARTGDGTERGRIGNKTDGSSALVVKVVAGARSIPQDDDFGLLLR